MSEPFLGQIQWFGFNFAPRGWANCDGQLLPISQNQALYSLYGTTYGGDGRQTFGLPDLRGRVAVDTGQGPGLPNYALGQKGGETEVTLNANQIPSHTHPFEVPCNAGDAGTDAPVNSFLAKGGNGGQIYATTGGATMGAGATVVAGLGQAHNNMQPYQVIRFCVALQGLFPSRN